MKQILVILSFLLIAMPAQAKSYLCRADGSVEAFENGEETQIVKPLKQHDIEEMPLPPKAEPAPSEPEKKPIPKSRSYLVPLTQKDIDERSAV